MVLPDIQLFKRRRAEQLAAVKSFRKNSYEKQVSVVNMISNKMFKVIESSRVLLEASDFIPGSSPFPQDENIRDALSNILENTALFGEIVLRFPDIASKVLKDNNDYSVLFKWAVGFAQQNKNLLDDSTITLIGLVSQELNYTERSGNYTNPYRKFAKNYKHELNRNLPEIIVKKKKPREIKKGPRLSPVHLEL